jgi:hypothetical protein
MPEAIAESVVQEVERFLQADLPADYAAPIRSSVAWLSPRNSS